MPIVQPCSTQIFERNNVATFDESLDKNARKFLLPTPLRICQAGGYVKKQSEYFCGVAAIWHFSYRSGDRDLNVVGDCWNGLRAIGRGTGGCGQMDQVD
jgi:hypothetical protein